MTENELEVFNLREACVICQILMHNISTDDVHDPWGHDPWCRVCNAYLKLLVQLSEVEHAAHTAHTHAA